MINAKRKYNLRKKCQTMTIGPGAYEIENNKNLIAEREQRRHAFIEHVERVEKIESGFNQLQSSHSYCTIECVGNINISNCVKGYMKVGQTCEITSL